AVRPSRVSNRLHALKSMLEVKLVRLPPRRSWIALNRRSTREGETVVTKAPTWRHGRTPAGDLSALRKGNQMRGLAALRDYGPLSQKELAERVQLSQASISNMVAELLRLDQITLTERVDGRRYKIVSLSGRLGLVLGIGIDHHKIEVVAGNLACEID